MNALELNPINWICVFQDLLKSRLEFGGGFQGKIKNVETNFSTEIRVLNSNKFLKRQ